MQLFVRLVFGVVVFHSFSSARPNVLFIVSDDLRPSLGVYGNHVVKSPNIDALASDGGFIFTRAYVQQAVCSPSRISFLTGRRPDTTHILNNAEGIDWRSKTGNFTTLPEHFKANGYFAASIGKVFGGEKRVTNDFPCSWTVPSWHPSTETYKMAKVCPNPDGSLHMNILCAVNVSQQPEGSLPDIQSTGYALELLKNFSKNSEQPFFLAVGYHKPHVPLKFPEQYLDQYPLSDISLPTNKRYPPGLPTVAWEPWTDVRRREDVMALNLSFPYGPMLDNFAQKIIQHYYASTTYVDSELGRLLKGLKDSGLENNTIISFIGDHGWQLGENQEWAKYSNFETAVRVPLILRLPERSSGPVFINGLVELVDLMPTLSELCGLDVPKECPEDSSDVAFCTEGFSFVPLLLDSNTSKPWKQAVFSQFPRPSDLPQNNSDEASLADIKIMGYSMRTARYRYTEWVGYDSQRFKQNWDDVHARELYDDQENSMEDHNLVNDSSHADVVKEMSSRLRKGWRAAMPIETN